MKNILPFLLIISTSAWAGDEEFQCEKSPKHDHAVECTAKQDGVAVQRIELNGGDCESSIHPKIHHKIMHKGDKFTVPGAKECGYVAGVTVYTHSGKTQHFRAM